ncbi:MAG: hypothetical protein JO099_22510, partial [Acidobacteriia bacterium]|nr:hypothetical protein [Terriglobia bacterium]
MGRASGLPIRNSVQGEWLLGVFLGIWAAAIALVPTLEVKILLATVAALAALVVWTLQKPGRWIGCFVATALLLPPLPFALGDSGPHPCLAFAGIGLLAGMVWLPHWHIPAAGLNLALGTLLFVLLASIAPAAVYSGGPLATVSLARVGLLGIAVYLFLFTAYGPAG